MAATITGDMRRREVEPALQSVPREVGWPLGAGVSWLVYGWFELSMPFGADTVYDGRRGFEVVVDRGLFWLYSVPGAFAVMATAMTLILITRGLAGRRARWSRRVSGCAMALGGMALVGVAVGAVPLYFASQVFATPVLGAAAWLAAGPAATPSQRLRLRGLGAAAWALLGLWPAVCALGVLSPEAGAVLVGCFGMGWATLAPAVAAGGRRSACERP